MTFKWEINLSPQPAIREVKNDNQLNDGREVLEVVNNPGEEVTMTNQGGKRPRKLLPT